MVYDGDDNVMMSDHDNSAVHMYSVLKAQYKCRLTINTLAYLMGLAFDLEKSHLCVGISNQNRIDAYKFAMPSKGRTDFDFKVKI